MIRCVEQSLLYADIGPNASAQKESEMDERMSLQPCPFCGHAGPFDQWPCEWLDNTEANAIRCPMCHGAAPTATWSLRHRTQPAQAVDVDSLAQEIRRVDGNHSLGAGALAEALMPLITRAIGNEQAEGWGVPNGWKLVPHEPSAEMLDAGWRIAGRASVLLSRNALCAVFQAMWNATPHPTHQGHPQCP